MRQDHEAPHPRGQMQQLRDVSNILWRERNLLDDIDEIEQAARQTPSERFAAGLALSDLAIAMFRGNPDAPVLDRLEDLEEKARLWAAPLQASKR